MSGTYAPIATAGGFTSFTEIGQTGWYQLATPAATLPTMGGTAPPVGAQGMLVQANTPIRYMFSPDVASGGATDYMELPAGGTVFVFGQTWIDNFVVLLGNGAQFSIQYIYGNQGPTPRIASPGSGGIIPPPPPGIGALPTNNVVHVMKNGNDATGTRNRLDLPFLTITAGKAVLQPGDTMVIWPGTYNEGNIDVADVTYLLLGCTIEGAAADTGTFIFPDSGTYMRIAGTGTITHENDAEAGSGCIVMDNNNPAARLDVECTRIFHPSGAAFFQNSGFGTCTVKAALVSNATSYPTVQGGGTLRIEGSMEQQGTGIAFDAGTGNAQICGPIVSQGVGVFASSGTVEVYGPITAESNCLSVSGTADVLIHGNCTTVGNSSEVVAITGGNVQVVGTVTGGLSGCSLGSGMLMVLGDIVCPQLCVSGSGTAMVVGNMTNTNTSKNAIVWDGGNLMVRGDISSGLTCLVVSGGSVDVYGNLLADLSEPASAALETIGGTTTVYGNTQGSRRAVECNGGTVMLHGTNTSLDNGIVLVSGNCTAYGDTIAAGKCIEITTGTLRHYGDLVRDNDNEVMLQMQGGEVLLAGRVANVDTAGGFPLVNLDGGTLQLAATARLVQDGTGSSVDSGTAQTINVYPGASSNAAVGVNISQNGTLNVAAWVS
jgi:hypothetical protein